MKRSILALFLCVALLLTACGNTNSSSDKPSPEDALMSKLEGMYVATLGINPVYYLFQDGEVYIAEIPSFVNEVTRILEDTIDNYGIYAWETMDFQNVLEKLDPMNVFHLLLDVRIDASNNAVILHEGTRDEKQIVLSDDGVTIQEVNAIGVAPATMEKLSDHADFSGERFETTFQSAKARCTAPASMFWAKPSRYAEQIMQLHPEIKDWEQLSEEIYHQNSPIKGVSSNFVVTSSSITLVMGRNDNTDITAFFVSYKPGTSGSQIAIQSRMGYGLEELMKYVEIALGDFPGELTAKEISRRIGSQYSPSGALDLKITINSVQFHFIRGAAWGEPTIVLVQADQIPLASLLDDTGSQKPASPTNPEPTTPPEAPTEPKPTTPPSTPVEPDPTVPPCSHSYSAATCTKPKTCTLCGKTEGSALGHSYTAATCTTPKTCTRCGNTTGKAAGHSWKEATCTAPATCTSCQKTSGEPAGHDWNYTECQKCEATDFSCLSKQVYTDIACYDAKTGAGYDVENVSISDNGVLTFTFKGNTYSITLKQTRGDYWESYYDCYINGVLEPDAEARTSRSEGLNFHFKWMYLDGCNLYFGLFP